MWEGLQETINAQLQSKHLITSEGQVSIIEATIVEAHQVKGKSKEDSTYGYKVHSNCDKDSFILKQVVTPGNVYDGNKREDLLTGKEEQVYADSVYHSKKGEEVLEKCGVESRIQRKGCRYKKLTQEGHDYNKEVVTRAIIEHQFAEYKERYGFAERAAIAHNLKKHTIIPYLWLISERVDTTRTFKI